MFVGVVSHSTAKTVKTIDTFGVYVVAKKGYVKVMPYNHVDNFVDFKHLQEVASVERGTDKVRLIVYSNDFKTSNYAFEVRPVQTTIKIDEVSFSAKPLKKKNMYELILDKAVADGNMLHVYAPEVSGYRMGVIVLGDTQKELVKYFSDKKQLKAYAMLAYLEDALVAFPENKKLKALLPYWQQAAKDEKDVKAYGYIDDNWRKYNDATKIHLKVRYLRSMIGEINGYLRDHPDGKKAVEAKQRREFAEKKIKEFEPLL
jgi:hypothetical protein